MPAFHALYIAVSHLGCPGAVDPVCSSGVMEPVWTSEDQLELKKRHIASLFNLRGRVLSEHTALPLPPPSFGFYFIIANTQFSHRDLKPLRLLHDFLIYKKTDIKNVQSFQSILCHVGGQRLILKKSHYSSMQVLQMSTNLFF